MTNEQLISYLKLLSSYIDERNNCLIERFEEDGIEYQKHVHLLFRPTIMIDDLISELKPAITICRCGEQKPGNKKLCHECLKLSSEMFRKLAEDGKIKGEIDDLLGES